MNKEKLLKELTLEEKAALLSGTDFMNTNSVPRLDIPTIYTADGPHGLRKQKGKQDNGISQSEPSTAFPTAATSASSFNPENLRLMGEAIAEECLHYGVNVLLGPAVNIKKNPRCGRNFEYFSEDPLVAGVMGTEMVKGVQSKNVGTSVKHFAANNSENYRFMGESVVDERALREIYLKPYEMIVKDAHPYTMMCAYNKINGTFCSENKWLLTDVLRKEWGFDGIVMTDWGAIRERAEGVEAGLDLEMPGDTHCRKVIIDAVKNGELSEEDLNKAVMNMLTLVERCSKQVKLDSFDKQAHHDLAVKIATDSAVLLKNEGSLPLNKNEKFLIVGELFEKMRYQGAGSSMIHPTMVTTHKEALDKRNIKYEYHKGYKENTSEVDMPLLQEALRKAQTYDKVIVYAGLTDLTESEGCDRENMSLPENQSLLIKSLIKMGKEVVLVFFGGSPVELPFIEGLSAMLNMYLSGQGAGEATTELLFGEVNPSGKLAETWVKRQSDVPFDDIYSNSITEVYKESIYVGYRYYDKAKKEVLFPFGFGLSYTTFEYSNLAVTEDGDNVTVTCEIKNTGKRVGAEVVQVYVKNDENSYLYKAEKELRAFTKVYLNPGESKTATLSFQKSDLAYFDIKIGSFILENGVYEIQIGSSSKNIHLVSSLKISTEFEQTSPYSENINEIYKNLEFKKITNQVFEEMSGEKISPQLPALPLHFESRFTDFQLTFMGRILFNAVTSVSTKQLKEAKKLPEGTQRDNSIKGASFLRRILESNSIRSFCMSAGSSMPINIAEGFVLLGNGKVFKGLKRIMKKEVLPPLPKNCKTEAKALEGDK